MNDTSSTPADLNSQILELESQSRARIATTFESLTTRLIEAGVVLVTCVYSGCGDDGNIEEVSYFADEAESVRKDLTDAMDQEMETFFDDLLTSRHSGWENNDGGEGVFTWHVPKRSLEHEHSDFYTERDTTTHFGLDDVLAGEPS